MIKWHTHTHTHIFVRRIAWQSFLNRNPFWFLVCLHAISLSFADFQNWTLGKKNIAYYDILCIYIYNIYIYKITLHYIALHYITLHTCTKQKTVGKKWWFPFGFFFTAEGSRDDPVWCCFRCRRLVPGQELSWIWTFWVIYLCVLKNIKPPESWLPTLGNSQIVFYFPLGNPRATGYGAGSQLLSVGTDRSTIWPCIRSSGQALRCRYGGMPRTRGISSKEPQICSDRPWVLANWSTGQGFMAAQADAMEAISCNYVLREDWGLLLWRGDGS